MPSSCEREARELVRPTFGIGERVLDREDHVVDRELRHPGAVAELDHGVHQGARVDDDVDRLGRDAEQVRRFDELEPLVDQGRGVDADLGAHRPGRMPQRLLPADGREGRRIAMQERSTGGRQDEPPNLRAGAAAQRLVKGDVLAVDRHDLDAVRVREVGQQPAGDDQRLLVGQSDRLALPRAPRRPEGGPRPRRSPPRPCRRRGAWRRRRGPRARRRSRLREAALAGCRALPSGRRPR